MMEPSPSFQLSPHGEGKVLQNSELSIEHSNLPAWLCFPGNQCFKDVPCTSVFALLGIAE